MIGKKDNTTAGMKIFLISTLLVSFYTFNVVLAADFLLTADNENQKSCMKYEHQHMKLQSKIDRVDGKLMTEKVKNRHSSSSCDPSGNLKQNCYTEKVFKRFGIIPAMPESYSLCSDPNSLCFGDVANYEDHATCINNYCIPLPKTKLTCDRVACYDTSNICDENGEKCLEPGGINPENFELIDSASMPNCDNCKKGNCINGKCYPKNIQFATDKVFLNKLQNPSCAKLQKQKIQLYSKKTTLENRFKEKKSKDPSYHCNYDGFHHDDNTLPSFCQNPSYLSKFFDTPFEEDSGPCENTCDGECINHKCFPKGVTCDVYGCFDLKGVPYTPASGSPGCDNCSTNCINDVCYGNDIVLFAGVVTV